MGRQYLSSIGKIDNGVVCVSSLWADERIYYPLEVEPYTPGHHFEGGKEDPRFRTKPQIALELVEALVERGIPFRAVVGDILYGEHRGLRKGLERKRIPYVLALKPSYAWYRPITEPGTVEEIAQLAAFGSSDDPGEWVKLSGTFRDGHSEEWWALEAECRPFGKEKPRRLVVATTDPVELPERTTWYLLTNLPAPGSSKATESRLEAAEVAEVVRLYSLRSWIEQSYKQVKNALGWAHYQVRSDLAIRRHWQLVCCAFTFCWLANTDFLEKEAPPGVVLEEEATSSSTSSAVERGKKGDSKPPASSVLARGTKKSEEMAGAIRNAHALLEGVLREAPTQATAKAA